MGGDPALTYTAVASRIGCSERHVYRLVKSGQLRAQPKGGGHRGILESEVDRYLLDRYRARVELAALLERQRRRRRAEDT